MHIFSTYKYTNEFDDYTPDHIGGISLTNLRKLRWLSIITMHIVVLIIYFLTPLDIPIFPLLVAVLTIILFSIAITSHNTRNSLQIKPFVVLELVFDILAWAIFLYFCGGVCNPLISFLLPVAVIGAIILPADQAWRLGLFVLFIYALLWQSLQHPSLHDSNYALKLHMIGMALSFAISLVASLWSIIRMSEALRKCNDDLNAARNSAQRDEWIISLGGLAACTAHELSTPLSTLSTLVEELRTSPGPVYVSRTDLDLMETQLSACRRSLNQLTQQASPPSTSETESCTADEWLLGLSQAWLKLHPSAEIDISLEPDLSRLHVVPIASLEQALCNLVDNAVAAHPTGIKLSVCCTEDDLVFRVTDHGPGISPVTLKNIEKGLPLISNKGLGLGLVLSKRAVERYGGKIEFNNLTQGGTEAKVVVPLYEVTAK
jgi:two-component system sensor histidine kinase RegB